MLHNIFHSFHRVTCLCRDALELLKLDECRDLTCPVQWPTCPSPVHLDNWQKLWCHPDQTFANYIHSGLSAGFCIRYSQQAPSLKSATKNHPSAYANASVVLNHIEAELEAGRLVMQALTQLYIYIPAQLAWSLRTTTIQTNRA